MLNADEKINELGSLLEQQQLENEHLREQLDRGDSFKSKCTLFGLNFIVDENTEYLRS
jgi:hypothetical protein